MVFDQQQESNIQISNSLWTRKFPLFVTVHQAKLSYTYVRAVTTRYGLLNTIEQHLIKICTLAAAAAAQASATPTNLESTNEWTHILAIYETAGREIWIGFAFFLFDV